MVGKRGGSMLINLDHFASFCWACFSDTRMTFLTLLGLVRTTGKQKGADQLLGKRIYSELMGLEMERSKTQDLYYVSIYFLKCVSALVYGADVLWR
ncbi:hypothetical protein A35E_00046 [secondary endosymbiont of Heteropsylla cubana]|uniref:Uncharacterized protein n=1 Tax=secondary endosymbiont of Heteropsylla cubana TaxID=134287 RepID=J3VTR5_9ENTR|nr:hypothetical protein [secondary endosymbiont of Heteropsylla cubana]AFP85371.1 hypothetical protein A35E_00046 [secondary endosymbiont of Heteropsylla cubana]